MTTFAQRLRDQRLAAGMSQTELAGQDMSPSYVSLMESGRRVPADELLDVIAQRLGTTAQFLRQGDDTDAAERVRLELTFADLDVANARPDRALDRLGRIDLGTLSDRDRTATLAALSRAREASGDLEGAVPLLESLLERARAEGRLLDAAATGGRLVGCYHRAGNLGRALWVGEQVLADIEGLGLAGTSEHLQLASTLLMSMYESGEVARALVRVAALVEVAERVQEQDKRALMYKDAAAILAERGDLLGARQLGQRALACLADPAVRDLPRLRFMWAWLLLRAPVPQPREALVQLHAAEVGLVNVGSSVEAVHVKLEGSRAHLLVGDIDAAHVLAESATGPLALSAGLEMCDVLVTLGDVGQARGEVVWARAQYVRAAERLASLPQGRAKAAMWLSLGDRFTSLGDARTAGAYYRAALAGAGVRARPAVPAQLMTAVTAPLDA